MYSKQKNFERGTDTDSHLNDLYSNLRNKKSTIQPLF